MVSVYFVLGIICDKYDSCTSINKRCSNDCDCCYPKCSFSWLYFRSYCYDNTNLLTPVSSFFNYKGKYNNIFVIYTYIYYLYVHVSNKYNV